MMPLAKEDVDIESQKWCTDTGTRHTVGRVGAMASLVTKIDGLRTQAEYWMGGGLYVLLAYVSGLLGTGYIWTAVFLYAAFRATASARKSRLLVSGNKGRGGGAYHTITTSPLARDAAALMLHVGTAVVSAFAIGYYGYSMFLLVPLLHMHFSVESAFAVVIASGANDSQNNNIPVSALATPVDSNDWFVRMLTHMWSFYEPQIGTYLRKMFQQQIDYYLPPDVGVKSVKTTVVRSGKSPPLLHAMQATALADHHYRLDCDVEYMGDMEICLDVVLDDKSPIPAFLHGKQFKIYLKEIGFKGRFRFEARWLPDPDFLQDLSISCISPPFIDLGVHLFSPKAPDLLWLPSVRTLIQRYAFQTLEPMLVFPNKYNMEFNAPHDGTQAVTVQKCGLLKVKVKKARNLLSKDVGGKSDPYVKVRLGSTTKKTTIIKKTLNPEWNEEFRFTTMGDAAEVLQIFVNDWDRVGNHESLGMWSKPVFSLLQEMEFDGHCKFKEEWFDLVPKPRKEKLGKKKKRNMARGQVLLAITFSSMDGDASSQVRSPEPSATTAGGVDGGAGYSSGAGGYGDTSAGDISLNASMDAAHCDLSGLKQTASASSGRRRSVSMADAASCAHRPCMLTLRLEEAEDLIAADRGGKSDPYVILSIAGKQKHKSEIVMEEIKNPKWEQTFTFAVIDPLTEILDVNVMDYDRIGSDDKLGNASIDLSNLTTAPTQLWCKLENVPHGAVRVIMTGSPAPDANCPQGTALLVKVLSQLSFLGTSASTIIQASQALGVPGEIAPNLKHMSKSQCSQWASFLLKLVDDAEAMHDAIAVVPSLPPQVLALAAMYLLRYQTMMPIEHAIVERVARQVGSLSPPSAASSSQGRQHEWQKASAAIESMTTPEQCSVVKALVAFANAAAGHGIASAFGPFVFGTQQDSVQLADLMFDEGPVASKHPVKGSHGDSTCYLCNHAFNKVTRREKRCKHCDKAVCGSCSSRIGNAPRSCRECDARRLGAH